MHFSIKKYSFISLIILNYLNLASQNDLPKVYKFSNEILNNSTNSEISSWELSYTSEYIKTLQEWDKNEEDATALTPKEINDFKKYFPFDAIDFISKKAKSEQIIIINEAHHQPYHRVFTTLLLKNLYEEGFRYLCLEALGDYDSALSIRNYPIINSGGYTKEPMFGNLIRTALELGFQVLAYEDTKNSGFDSQGNNLREVEQAKNIKKILDKNPKAKILVHCGFGHIKETPLKFWGKAMAGRLTEYTGINPLTIDQVTLTEHSDTLKEDPYFKLIDLKYHAIFKDSTGKLFNGKEDNKQYDLRVYHPRSKWINGRPHWVYENNRVPYLVNQEFDNYPIQIYAYIENENHTGINPYEYAVPFDIVELNSKNDNKALSLKKGKFILKVVNKMNKEKEIKIEIQ